MSKPIRLLLGKSQEEFLGYFVLWYLRFRRAGATPPPPLCARAQESELIPQTACGRCWSSTASGWMARGGVGRAAALGLALRLLLGLGLGLEAVPAPAPAPTQVQVSGE